MRHRVFPHVPLILAAAVAAPPLQAQTPATTKLPIASVEARWENVYCDLTELSRPAPSELMVRFRYRNGGKQTIRFPNLTNIIPLTRALDPSGGTLFGGLKDAGGAEVSSTTLAQFGSKPLGPGTSQLHWIKLEAPPPSVTSVTILAPGCMPFEAAPIGGSPGVALVTAPAKAMVSQDSETEGVVVEVVEVRRAPGGFLNAIFRYRNSGAAPFRFPNLSDQIRHAYVIDPQNRRKYQVAQDREKTPICSTSLGIGATGGDEVPPGSALTMWAKFPAPPEAAKTVSLTVFGAPPFDNLAVAGAGTGSTEGGSALAGAVVGLDAALRDLGAKVTDTEIRIDMSADVLFDFDKADLKKEAEPSLQKVATVLKAHPDAKVSIEGHTDAKGTDAYNLPLSERRAAAVKQWLVANAQVNGTNVTTRGWGRSKPVAPNVKPDGADDPEGRAKNRRVEIIVRKGA